MLSENFWTFLCTSVIGCCLGVARMAYKSKCKQIRCCCLKIIRDTGAEEKIDERVPPASPGRHASTSSNDVNNYI